MRTLRLSLAGLVTVALLGGAGGTVIAQGEDTDWVTPVSGSRLTMSEDGTDMAYSEDGGYMQGRGLAVTETWDWSDPRLPGDMVSILNFDAALSGGWPGQVITGAVLLEEADGSWTGPQHALAAADGTGQGLLRLTGHGDYDGLSAVLLLATDDPDCVGCLEAEGFIYRSPLTPMPDPLEPSVE